VKTHLRITMLATFFVSASFALAQQSNNQPSLDAVEKTDETSGQVPNPVEAEKKDAFNLTYYEPMYVLVGHPVSKINFSFKYQFIRNVPIYLGFVQNIFWLFEETSHPFRDTNFNPRLFYRFSFDPEDGEDYLDLIAFEHKSNGKGNPESRSFDGSGAKFAWRTKYENFSLKGHLKGLWRYDLDETNKDFEKYVGPFEVGFAFSIFSGTFLDKAELSYRAYTGGEWGEDFKRSSHEVGISFRLFGRTLTPAIYVQYFNGYSESLLNYDQREENLRVGFLL
jgi:phospholipase A1